MFGSGDVSEEDIHYDCKLEWRENCGIDILNFVS
jgi:hypothetical protein